MEIYVITKSIGQLKQLQVNSQGFNSKEHKSYMTKELIRSWFEYGRRYTYQYEWFLHNESKPIEINETLFDNKVELYLDTGSALAYGPMREVTLSGKTSENEIFETTFRWYSKYGGNLNPVTTIIYSMVLTSIFGPEKIKWLFNICFGQFKLEDRNLGDLISTVEEIKSIFTIANKKYDFFGFFYQECMKHIIEVIQEKLNDFKILI